MESWILNAVRKYAEEKGLSVSAVLARGALREIAASHTPATRTAMYGAGAVATQEADEQIVVEDLACAIDEHRGETT
ncbi:hypothetical protein FH608_011275 [Nonomuraea phyllanthi]|uniref:Uncharacterized protein n=1 Tax=Nonomuraea phyllanthi TaxID=2219224 RepID=A0A5C4WR09_9ACTN|nr:hypothetical protein [Nonomuraea phyllanthi]KAB8196039.1 hypothetical protein FH608_011275 [Nonomuraea phyllanthi]QFY07498.1 hypothetical protein GBF35_13095 [Nonomuraea phyllanthi]